LAVQIVNIYCM